MTTPGKDYSICMFTSSNSNCFEITRVWLQGMQANKNLSYSSVNFDACKEMAEFMNVKVAPTFVFLYKQGRAFTLETPSAVDLLKSMKQWNDTATPSAAAGAASCFLEREAFAFGAAAATVAAGADSVAAAGADSVAAAGAAAAFLTGVFLAGAGAASVVKESD